MRTPTPSAVSQFAKKIFTRTVILAIATITIFLTSDLAAPQAASAYPFWAQATAPETPREATGRLVCANCHLAEKPTEIEIPQAVLPDTVFEAVVKIPYDLDTLELYGDNATEGPLMVGAVLMLPDGFQIAPEDRIPEEMKEELGGLYFQEYVNGESNVVIVGPLPGDQFQEIVFPILSPDPRTDSSIHFGKYQVHVGGNRGRGQIYPTGDPSNNNPVSAEFEGVITAIGTSETGDYEVSINTGEETVIQTVPAIFKLIASVGQEIVVGEDLTNDPNVGGFGQKDAEIVLQSPARIGGLIVFIGGIMLAQILLVIKKKQVEVVQAAEMEF
ncbi:MAG: apocytochrome f [Cyanobacteria bacterium P01_F01_bin.143]